MGYSYELEEIKHKVKPYCFLNMCVVLSVMRQSTEQDEEPGWALRQMAGLGSWPRHGNSNTIRTIPI